MAQLKIKSVNQVKKRRRSALSFLLLSIILIAIIINQLLKLVLEKISDILVIDIDYESINEIFMFIIYAVSVLFILSIIMNVVLIMTNGGLLRHKNIKRSIKFNKLKNDLDKAFIKRNMYNKLNSEVNEKIIIAETPRINIIDDMTIHIENLTGITDKLEKFKSDLSSVLKNNLVCETYRLDKSQKFFISKLIDMSADNRKVFKSVEEYNEYLRDYENYQIPFMNRYFYDSSKTPHMLIAGVSGSGKSYCLYHIMFTVLANNCEMYVIDRKRDIAKISNVISSENVASEINDIKDLLNKVNHLMIEREKEIESLSSDKFSVDFTDYDMKPLYLIIDEMSAMLSELDNKEQKELMKIIKNIAQRGRSAGVVLVVSMQQPNAQNLPTEIRDQIGFKLILGNSPNTTRNLVFTADEIQDIDFNKGEGFFTDESKQHIPSIMFVPSFEYDLNIENLNKLIALNKV